MPRTVYSLRIFGHAGLVTTAGKVGPIVPDNLIYVVRDMDVVERTGTRPASFFAYNGNLGILWSVESDSGDITGWHQWHGRQVFEPGEQVGVSVGVGTWSIAISGYQLTLP